MVPHISSLGYASREALITIVKSQKLHARQMLVRLYIQSSDFGNDVMSSDGSFVFSSVQVLGDELPILQDISFRARDTGRISRAHPHLGLRLVHTYECISDAGLCHLPEVLHSIFGVMQPSHFEEPVADLSEAHPHVSFVSFRVCTAGLWEVWINREYDHIVDPGCTGVYVYGYVAGLVHDKESITE